MLIRLFLAGSLGSTRGVCVEMEMMTVVSFVF
jgi:hypothetical protein